MMRIILLRGLGREQQHWGALLSVLSAYFPDAKIETPDLAGSGILNDVTSPSNIEAYIPALTAQISPLHKITESNDITVLIGLSLGAMVALHWYAQCHEKFSHLFLLNASSPLSPFYQRMRLGNVTRQLTPLLSNNTNANEVARYKLTCNKLPMDDAVIKQWVTIQHQRPVKWSNLLKQLWAASLFTLPKQHKVKPKKKGNIVIFAATNDQLVHVRCSEKLAQYYNVPIVYHPWAGHDLAQDDPKWLCHQLARFIT